MEFSDKAIAMTFFSHKCCISLEVIIPFEYANNIILSKTLMSILIKFLAGRTVISFFILFSNGDISILLSTINCIMVLLHFDLILFKIMMAL
jgi:hypothetical protein